jgi:hypothetical protein
MTVVNRVTDHGTTRYQERGIEKSDDPHLLVRVNAFALSLPFLSIAITISFDDYFPRIAHVRIFHRPFLLLLCLLHLLHLMFHLPLFQLLLLPLTLLLSLVLQQTFVLLTSFLFGGGGRRRRGIRTRRRRSLPGQARDGQRAVADEAAEPFRGDGWAGHLQRRGAAPSAPPLRWRLPRYSEIATILPREAFLAAAGADVGFGGSGSGYGYRAEVACASRALCRF